MIEKRINYRFGGGYQGGAPGNTGQSRGGGGRDAGMGMAGKSRGPSRDVSAGVGKGGEGTLADPREKMDYFGPTRFGPAQKYSGDGFFSGYRNLDRRGQPLMGMAYLGDRLKSFASGLNPLSLIGGLVAGPIGSFIGRGISSLGALRDYDTLADYAKGELGLFQDDEDEVDTIDIRDKYNRSGIMNPNIRPTQMFNFDPTQFNTRNRSLGELVAELTDKQKAFINSKKFGLQENMISPQQVFDEITNPNLGIYDTGTFGFGAQEPTTEEEYNDYLRSLGLTQTI